MVLKIERHLDRGLFVFSKGLSGQWLPMRNEHGQVIDFEQELRLLGGERQVGDLMAPLAAADRKFLGWEWE
jgi:hypothetical protein